tara:strand:+ start:20736 stop:21500 length:765 start_codon:yes stop_codon:yes gene_type:complete
MITNFEALFLGIIQGLTEFLPISSSGHLILAQEIIGVKQIGNELEVLVHMGTLISIIIIYRKDIQSLLFSIQKKNTQFYLICLIIASVPAAFCGLMLKDMISPLFENVISVGIALIVTGIVLCLSSFVKKKRVKNQTLFLYFMIGCAQAIAIIPGISRSGITISVALFLGLQPKEASRFSFLLAIPVIFGAGILTFFDVTGNSQIPVSSSVIAFLSAFVVGLLSLSWLIRWLESGKFYYFGIYCFLIGLLTLVL